MVARTFKARYFNESHVLQKTKGKESSFIWTGIWEAKEKIKAGFRWVLGNGESIRALKDPRIKGNRKFYVKDSHCNGVRNDLACSYFHPNSKAWDVTKVQQDFHETDAHLILQPRIHQLNVQDRIAWCGTTNGVYSVKIRYHFRVNNNTETYAVTNSKGWSRLWNLSLPHKLRTFLWRFCKNNIPVRKLLRSKGIAVPTICPMCEEDIEHLLHIFFDCKFSMECWRIEGLIFDIQSVEWAPGWLLDRIANEDKDTVNKIAEVLWCLWFVRNKKVWEGQVFTAQVAMEISFKQVKDWQEAIKSKASFHKFSPQHSEISRIVWCPPAHGRSKINVDASLQNGGSVFKIGDQE